MNAVIRSALVIPPAAVVTSGLILTMVSLIEFADRGLDKSEVVKLPDIFMPKQDIQTQRSVEKPDKPEMDDTPPPEVPQQDFDQIDGNAAVGQISGPSQVNARLDLNMGGGLAATDGEYLPIVKVAPQYPRRALARGLEGEVLVQYTVTKQGTVRDAVVVQSTNSVFDRAAVDSASRYKYKPRVVDGQAVEVPNVQTVIKFELAK